MAKLSPADTDEEMPDRHNPTRPLCARWIRVSALILLVPCLYFFVPALLPYLMGLNYASPGEILVAFLQILGATFVPLLFLWPVVWIWRVGSEAFRWFDSWLVFIGVGFLLFPVVFAVLLVALMPYAGSSLGGGMGAGAIALILALETSLAYGLPRLLLPSLRPGRFRDAAWSD